jgi:hypothetical protein
MLRKVIFAAFLRNFMEHFETLFHSLILIPSLEEATRPQINLEFAKTDDLLREGFIGHVIGPVS